jgi:hypothetical protein
MISAEQMSLSATCGKPEKITAIRIRKKEVGTGSPLVDDLLQSFRPKDSEKVQVPIFRKVDWCGRQCLSSQFLASFVQRTFSFPLFHRR